MIKTLILGGAVVTAAIILKKLRHRACIAGIGPEAAKRYVGENWHNADFVIIDVRTLPEFMKGHIETALPVDFHSRTFMDEVNKLDKGKTYLVYSWRGGRSRKAAHVMRRLGFRRVRVLAGGFHAWSEHSASPA